MGLIELFIVALGLSVDSFAVSVCAGLVNRKMVFHQALRMAFIFGLIQGVAPILGGWFGLEIRSLIESFDHWIALVLLAAIGIKMILDGTGHGSKGVKGNFNHLKGLITLGMATSIDAVVVGISMGLVGVNLWQAGLLIGLITLMASLTGIYLGSRFKGLNKMKLEIIAGIVLIGLGIKIFLEHILNNI